MKPFEKLLQYSRKLEEFQTARRAKEVDEIRKFDVALAHQGQRRVEQVLQAQQAADEQRQRWIEDPPIAETAFIKHQTGALDDLADFGAEVEQLRQQPVNDAFAIITEMQTFISGQMPPDLKQLAGAAADVFANELTDVTEAELQRELTHNEQEIQQHQPERPSRMPLPVFEEEEPIIEPVSEVEAEFLAADAVDIPATDPARTVSAEKPKTVFFFRPTPVPKTKK